jgi:hypothetical protein
LPSLILLLNLLSYAFTGALPFGVENWQIVEKRRRISEWEMVIVLYCWIAAGVGLLQVLDAVVLDCFIVEL